MAGPPIETDMLLYYAPGTCALAPHIALEWTGSPYEVEKVELRSEAYRAINPMGTVPAMTDGGTRLLTQADAILKYIVHRFPEADLGAGEGVMAEFNLNEALAFLTGDVHPAFWPFFAPQRFTTQTDKESLEAVKNASYARIDRVMAHLDGMLDGQMHVVNQKRTVADPYAFAMCRWTQNIPRPWTHYPAIASFMNRMAADPGVQAAMAAQGLRID